LTGGGVILNCLLHAEVNSIGSAKKPLIRSEEGKGRGFGKRKEQKQEKRSIQLPSGLMAKKGEKLKEHCTKPRSKGLTMKEGEGKQITTRKKN